ncbi:MAG: hypothetical protein ABIH77_02555 [Pseudomonadota bacterium]|nr:hypothetical protein [Gammaproteobacteria bacterium]MBU1926921.1 hypothetical protein [Gammaproteobacteria bacterium]MBU2546696.1 hypothetical protein [Gammaproteobacteria bacterium]
MFHKRQQLKALEQFYFANYGQFSVEQDVDLHIQCVYTGLTKHGFNINGLLSSVAGKGFLIKLLAPGIQNKNSPDMFKNVNLRLFGADVWTVNALDRRFKKYSKKQLKRQKIKFSCKR